MSLRRHKVLILVLGALLLAAVYGVESILDT